MNADQPRSSAYEATDLFWDLRAHEHRWARPAGTNQTWRCACGAERPSDSAPRSTDA